MDFFRRAAGNPERVAIFSGSFNPPTRAHLALAEAALRAAEEVLFVLPKMLPHKQYEGVTFKQRVEMLLAATQHQPSFSVGASERGLFGEIAEECAGAYPQGARFLILCGRDAAERAAAWDYGDPNYFPAMLQRAGLLVAARKGDYRPEHEGVQLLVLPENYDHVSATEVRRRIAEQQPWEHLVPAAIVPLVIRYYLPA